MRNSAQTAADAAALAAAQDAREQLRADWLAVILEPDRWSEFVMGETYDEGSACEQAAALAAQNEATLVDAGCVRLRVGREGFRVTVRTVGTVGSTVVPGVEARRGIASAVAVIEPRCTFSKPDEEPAPEGPPPAEPFPDEPGSGPSEAPKQISGLTCDGEEWVVDPTDPQLPPSADLFTVRLDDDA